MTDAQAVAKELYRRVTAPCHYPSEPMDEKEARIELITDALNAKEREVWEKVLELIAKFRVCGQSDIRILREWCRRQGRGG